MHAAYLVGAPRKPCVVRLGVRGCGAGGGVGIRDVSSPLPPSPPSTTPSFRSMKMLLAQDHRHSEDQGAWQLEIDVLIIQKLHQHETKHDQTRKEKFNCKAPSCLDVTDSVGEALAPAAPLLLCSLPRGPEGSPQTQNCRQDLQRYVLDNNSPSCCVCCCWHPKSQSAARYALQRQNTRHRHPEQSHMHAAAQKQNIVVAGLSTTAATAVGVNTFLLHPTETVGVDKKYQGSGSASALHALKPSLLFDTECSPPLHTDAGHLSIG